DEEGKVILDDLLDFLEATINMNIEREKKIELFQQKIKDMEDLFTKSSLNDLENMVFKFKTDEKPLFNSDGFLNNLNEEKKVSEVKSTVPKIEDKPVIDNQTKQEPEIKIINNRDRKDNDFGKSLDFDLPPKPGEKIVVEE